MMAMTESGESPALSGLRAALRAPLTPFFFLLEMLSRMLRPAARPDWWGAGLRVAAMVAGLGFPVSGLPADQADPSDAPRYQAPRAVTAPVIDGIPDDSAWQRGDWYPVNYRWLGPAYSAEDFQGRFKLAWTDERLYVLFEFVDDVLFDQYADPLVQYWDDDTLEVFIDEDGSGGNHQYNHNAFAYHVALDNQAIDIGTDRRARDYNHHVESRWRRHGDTVIWEVGIAIYPDSYGDESPGNRPVRLHAGKIMGFMLAYCDNDGSELRENFIGSEDIQGKKDRGWIDADTFGRLELIE
jgi:hypothetical protein